MALMSPHYVRSCVVMVSCELQRAVMMGGTREEMDALRLAKLKRVGFVKGSLRYVVLYAGTDFYALVSLVMMENEWMEMAVQRTVNLSRGGPVQEDETALRSVVMV